MKFKVWNTSEERFVSESNFLITHAGVLVKTYLISGGEFEIENAKDKYIPVFYTKKHDKKRIELFEGDILEFKFPSGNKGMAIIVFDEKYHFGFRGQIPKNPLNKHDPATFSFYEMSLYCGIEKIGTKYENPELFMYPLLNQ